MLSRSSLSVRLLLLSLVAATLGACAVHASEGPSPEPPTPTPIEYASVIASARNAMDGVTSYRWAAEYEAAGTGGAAPFRAKYEGVWVDGDLDYVATYYANGEPVVQRSLYVDGRTFRRVDGVWQEQSEITPIGLPAWGDRSPVPLLDRGRASSTADGNWLVKGSRVFESPNVDWTITYDVTVLVDGGDKRLISTTTETTATNGDTSRTTIEFRDYDSVAEISLPNGPAGAF